VLGICPIVDAKEVEFVRDSVAARIAVRMSGEADCAPPVDAEMVAFTSWSTPW
jgi:hypothetical protein